MVFRRKRAGIAWGCLKTKNQTPRERKHCAKLKEGEKKMEAERLQKFLAEAGVASRRKSEELINQGRVKVNGKKATLGIKGTSDDIV